MNTNFTEKQFTDLLNRHGQNITLNNNTIKCIVKENQDSKYNFDTKKLLIYSNISLAQGDILKYNNNNYIVLLKENTITNVYTSYIISKIHQVIKVYINKVLYTIPSLIQSETVGVSGNATITFATGNLKIISPLQEEYKKLVLGSTRLISMQQAYQLIGVIYTQEGLLETSWEKTQINKEIDDMVLEIANRWTNEVKHNYVMELDISDIILQQEKTKQLSVIIKDTPNGGAEVIVNNPTIIYTVNNNSICTVNSSGLVTGIGVGSTTITVQFENIIKTININITAKDVITYTYKFKTITVDSVAYADTTTIEVEQTKTKALKVSEIEKITTVNGSNTSEIITNPSVVYSTNNSNITIGTTGLITGATVGTSIITISYTATDNTIITKNINVSCIAVQQPQVLTIFGDETIPLGMSKVYTSNKPCQFYTTDISNKSGKLWTTVEQLTDTSCKVTVTEDYIFDDGVYKKYFLLNADGTVDRTEYFALKVKITQY